MCKFKWRRPDIYINRNLNLDLCSNFYLDIVSYGETSSSLSLSKFLNLQNLYTGPYVGLIDVYIPIHIQWNLRKTSKATNTWVEIYSIYLPLKSCYLILPCNTSNLFLLFHYVLFLILQGWNHLFKPNKIHSNDGNIQNNKNKIW